MINPGRQLAQHCQLGGLYQFVLGTLVLFHLFQQAGVGPCQIGRSLFNTSFQYIPCRLQGLQFTNFKFTSLPHNTPASLNKQHQQ